MESKDLAVCLCPAAGLGGRKGGEHVVEERNDQSRVRGGEEERTNCRTTTTDNLPSSLDSVVSPSISYPSFPTPSSSFSVCSSTDNNQQVTTPPYRQPSSTLGSCPFPPLSPSSLPPSSSSTPPCSPSSSCSLFAPHLPSLYHVAPSVGSEILSPSPCQRRMLSGRTLSSPLRNPNTTTTAEIHPTERTSSERREGGNGGAEERPAGRVSSGFSRSAGGAVPPASESFLKLHGMNRNVDEDYKIPKWLIRQGLVCPYGYNKTFAGKYGIINYEICGKPEDPLVVTFHGLNGTHMTFQDVQDVLTKYGFRVLTFDLYGHGLSATPHFNLLYSTYGLDFFIKQTDELLAHLGLQDEPLNLIGFSMGCCIASGYARSYPAKTQRMILISPAGMLKNKPAPVRCLQACPCCIHCIPCVVCRCCFNKKRFMQKFSVEERRSGMAEALWNRLMWQLFVKRGVIGAFLGCVTKLPLWNCEQIFLETGTHGKPLLLLWGRQDAVCPPSTAKEVLECFPNGHLIVFRDATHLLLADQPQAAIATIMTFLEFPPDCQLDEWKYILPFNSKGLYVPRYLRAPPNTTLPAYLKQINYKPRYHVRLPQNEAETSTTTTTATTGPNAPSTPSASPLHRKPQRGSRTTAGLMLLDGPSSSQQAPDHIFHHPSTGPYITSPSSARPARPSPLLETDGTTQEQQQTTAPITGGEAPTGGGEGEEGSMTITEGMESPVGVRYYPRFQSGPNGTNDNGEVRDIVDTMLTGARVFASSSSLDSAGVVVAPDFLFHSQHPMPSASLQANDAELSAAVAEAQKFSTAPPHSHALPFSPSTSNVRRHSHHHRVATHDSTSPSSTSSSSCHSCTPPGLMYSPTVATTPTGSRHTPSSSGSLYPSRRRAGIGRLQTMPLEISSSRRLSLESDRAERHISLSSSAATAVQRRGGRRKWWPQLGEVHAGSSSRIRIREERSAKDASEKVRDYRRYNRADGLVEDLPGNREDTLADESEFFGRSRLDLPPPNYLLSREPHHSAVPPETASPLFGSARRTRTDLLRPWGTGSVTCLRAAVDGGGETCLHGRRRRRSGKLRRRNNEVDLSKTKDKRCVQEWKTRGVVEEKETEKAKQRWRNEPEGRRGAWLLGKRRIRCLMMLTRSYYHSSSGSSCAADAVHGVDSNSEGVYVTGCCSPTPTSGGLSLYSSSGNNHREHKPMNTITPTTRSTFGRWNDVCDDVGKTVGSCGLTNGQDSSNSSGAAYVSCLQLRSPLPDVVVHLLPSAGGGVLEVGAE
eukprot:GHVS01064543.1.p1 GENE.GHVS01064543.1~~GHVS01064543.1.p1  ORF type:complete len:1267 (+),score=237.42 GHVS01064543.1:178-3978(+)